MAVHHLYPSWIEAERQPIEGWDFSHLDGRMESGPLPWDYRQIVLERLRPDMRLLDMGTGGGEFLLSLRHPHRLTAVTEGYAPNLALCRERLSPLGIEVMAVGDDQSLPFPDERFGLIINRHEDFSAEEVYRCLRPGGLFITQQVGGGNNHDLAARLIPGCPSSFPGHTLANSAHMLVAAGFEILTQMQAFPFVRFFDIAALVYFARIIEWEFPGFSVDACIDQLTGLQEELDRTGHIAGTEHRFMIVAQKKQKESNQ